MRPGNMGLVETIPNERGRVCRSNPVPGHEEGVVRRAGTKLRKMKTIWLRSLGVLALLLSAGRVGQAQAYTPPPPPLTVDPCAVVPRSAAAPVDPKGKAVVCLPAAPAPAPAPSAADQFPFPGDVKGKAAGAEAFPYPGDAPAKAAKPAGSKTADEFPYPGESSSSPDAVPEGNTPKYVPDAPAGGGKAPNGEDSSSSSSSSSSDDAAPAGDDKGPDTDAGKTASPRGRRPLPKVSALSPDERVTQDLEVAKFYTDRGNFQAAYLRTKDAIKAMPEDAESHFALARAAEKLQKKEEAAAEYALYLKLDPAGDKTAAAQKALSQLR